MTKGQSRSYLTLLRNRKLLNKKDRSPEAKERAYELGGRRPKRKVKKDD